jgi:hypothetical protein
VQRTQKICKYGDKNINAAAERKSNVNEQHVKCWGNQICLLLSFSSSLGSTAQLRPWPPPQNPAEFLGGFSTIIFTW